MITIFTPTYNRAYSLPRLYESLCKQSDNDFEWLIVNDGSTDNTDELVKSYIAENRITINYIVQNNGGKHRAINRGVSEAKGELFFIVDSDDYLVPDAIKTIKAIFEPIRENPVFAGLTGLRIYPSGEKVGGECSFDILDCNALDFRYKYHIQGDMAEVFRTDILKQYPFPEFDDERFCPEALVWNRIALKYKLRYAYQRIYVCEYQPDGLTAKITRIRLQSSQASTLYYSELTRMPVPLSIRVKAAINYWRFSKKSDRKIYRISFIYNIIGILPGKLMKWQDLK